jgi:hypothetical protein
MSSWHCFDDNDNHANPAHDDNSYNQAYHYRSSSAIRDGIREDIRHTIRS